MGNSFIVEEELRSIYWGSRLIKPKGRSLLSAMNKENIGRISTGEPIYRSTDLSKSTELIDFCIIIGIDKNKITDESCLELLTENKSLCYLCKPMRFRHGFHPTRKSH